MSNLDYKERELIWVPKELAKEYLQLESVEGQEKLVRKIINDKKLDITEDLNLLDDHLLQFKSACLTHRRELERVYTEESNKIYSLWEDMGDIRFKLSENSKLLSNELKDIREEIKKLEIDTTRLVDVLSKLNIYGADELTTLANRINTLDDNTKEMLTFLIKNYTRN